MEEDNTLPPMQVIREPFLIRNPWFSIILVMVFYFLFQLIPQLIYALVVNVSFANAYPYVTRIIEFVSLGFLLLVFIPFLRIPRNNRSFSQYMKDIQLSTITWKSLFVGFLCIILVFILLIGSVYLSAVLGKFYWLFIRGYNIPYDPGIVIDFGYLLDPNETLNVYYALTPGIMEELAFRGIILVLLMKKYSWKKAVIIDGILFGLYHLLNLLGPTINFVTGEWSLELYIAIIRSVGFQVIYAASLGMAYAYFFVKARSIVPVILSHYMIDAFGGIVFIPNIGLETFGVQWIYFVCITLLGIGILPAIVNIYITKGFYRDPPINPWEIRLEQ